VGSSAVWTGEEVLVFGGNDDPPCSDLCFDEQHTDAAAYNPTTDQWRELADVPVNPHGFGLGGGVYVDGYVIGGLADDHGRMLSYDVAADEWVTSIQLPDVRDPAMIPAGDRLLLMSSCVCPNDPAENLAVDVESGEIEDLPPVPFRRSARRYTAVVNDDIYVFASPAGSEGLRGVVLRHGSERWSWLATLPDVRIAVYPDPLYPIVRDGQIVVPDSHAAFDVDRQAWTPLAPDVEASLPHEYDFPATPLNGTQVWLGDRWFAFGGHVNGGLTNHAYTWAPVD
jgi:hypothetical protein